MKALALLGMLLVLLGCSRARSQCRLNSGEAPEPTAAPSASSPEPGR
jgi:hypothetical protein